MAAAARNPWLAIPLADYEAHMAPPQVGQADLLANVLQDAVLTHAPRSVAVIGCAGGNGFDRVPRVRGANLSTERNVDTLNVGIFVYDDVEVLDFAGPFQVFTTAARVARPAKPFATFTIAASDEVQARGGLALAPSYTFGREPHIDVLIVPGGVVNDELDKSAVIEWISRRAAQAQLTASVCTGAFLLAKAGMLDGKSATTHWEDIDDFRRSFPGIPIDAHARWVDEGRIVTSAGISAGIDMSLHLVERLAGEALALRTARQMDYRWQREP